MIPIGSIISLAGQAASGIASAINNKRMQREREAEYARQQAEAEARAAENPLSRSENQHLLGQYDRSAKQQVENARNMSKITGATPEYGLGVQKAVAEGRADLMGQMSADASRRADKYRDVAERSRRNHYAEQLDARQARNQTYANLATNAANAFGAIVDSYGVPKSPEAQQQAKMAQQQAKMASSGVVVDNNALHSGPRDMQLQAGADMRAANTPEREVLQTTANAASAAKNATAAATPTPRQQVNEAFEQNGPFDPTGMSFELKGDDVVNNGWINPTWKR